MIAPGWQPTAAQVRAGSSGAILAIVGALVRRPDAVVLAVPLLVIACWGALRRPRSEPVVSETIDHATVREGEATTWRIEVNRGSATQEPVGSRGHKDRDADPDVGPDDDGGIDSVGAVLWAPPYAELDPPWGEMVATMTMAGASSRRETARFAIGLRSTRWGRRFVGPARVVASSPWAAFRWTSVHTGSRLVTTVPLPAVFDAAAPATHAVGLVGLDRSVRPGDGSEFAGIRAFQAGDRLRRIHWSRSLRTGSLHVTSTWADHDRHVVLVVDAFNDVGDSDGIDGRASSLDTTVRAAGALAEHHLRRGDRVALVVLGARGPTRVPAASGSRHLRRVLDVLASIEPATAVRDDMHLRLGLTGGSLVMMLSPMVSEVPLQRAISLAGRGIAVVVVDTLPEGVTDHDADDPFRALAWRIRLLERARELRAVRSAGVPVVEWRGPGSLDHVFRDLARRRSAPRVTRR